VLGILSACNFDIPLYKLWFYSVSLNVLALCSLILIVIHICYFQFSNVVTALSSVTLFLSTLRRENIWAASILLTGFSLTSNKQNFSKVFLGLHLYSVCVLYFYRTSEVHLLCILTSLLLHTILPRQFNFPIYWSIFYHPQILLQYISVLVLGYSHLKEEALDRTMWRDRFGRDFGPVVRQTAKWMNITFLYVQLFVCFVWADIFAFCSVIVLYNF
jgi:hypothetical protein